MERLLLIIKIIFEYPKRIFTKISFSAVIINSKIDTNSAVCRKSRIHHSIIDQYSYIGPNSTVVQAKIGKFCSIADKVSIGGASHPIDWVSTSPVFCRGRNVLKTNIADHYFEPYKETYIGNDVWIGTGALIKAGTKIGDGAVIGSGSVVTKDVVPYSIVAGNPAKLIRNRFDAQIIKELIEIKWWELNKKELTEVSRNFNNVDRFIESIKELKL